MKDQTPHRADTAEKTAAQAELLFNRLTKRRRHLCKWAKRIGTDAFRLYDRDIPEIPLLLDYYGGVISGALYQRPYEKDEREEEIWLKAMSASAGAALNIPSEHIFIKTRRRLSDRREGNVQYGRMGKDHFYRDVHEGDMVFRVNLSDYLDTGLFPDARKKRALLRAQAAGKRVLNLFAYTCSLSVAAAKNGAVRVDSVDISNTYLDWGAVNFVLNGMEAFYGEAEGSKPAFRLIRADVIEFIQRAAKEKLNWDIIILDPPSFSNSKKMRGMLDVRRDYQELIKGCLSLLAPAGTLYFSSNAKGFSPGFRLKAGEFSKFEIRDITEELVDEDFRGKKIPPCWTFSSFSS